MMSKLKVLLLSLLAVFAVGAVASASASALLWWVCLSGTGTTEYENNKCTKTKSGGHFILQLLPLNTLLATTSKGIGNQTLTAANGLEITCTGVTDSGWIENNSTDSNGIDGSTSTVYTGCKVLKPKPGGAECEVKSPNASGPGIIELETLETKLVTFSGGGMGDLFKPTNANNIFVKLEITEKANLNNQCGSIPFVTEVLGQVVGKVEASGKLNFTNPVQAGSSLDVGPSISATYTGVVENLGPSGALIEAKEEL